jgi:hypothetical protein
VPSTMRRRGATSSSPSLAAMPAASCSGSQRWWWKALRLRGDQVVLMPACSIAPAADGARWGAWTRMRAVCRLPAS